MKVKIPFMPRFASRMIGGIKTWTSRTRKYGNPGDTFEAFDHEFEIVKVERRTLGDILDHWREEGCDSRKDAVETWKMLHSKRGDLQERLYVHVFRRISI
jgi:hypothetical protein